MREWWLTAAMVALILALGVIAATTADRPPPADPCRQAAPGGYGC